MSRRIGKYEFNSVAEVEAAIDSLGFEDTEDGGRIATHKHTIIRLGNVVLTPGEYDEEGNEITAPVLSDKYHVDVLWKGLKGAPIYEEVETIDENGDTITEEIISGYEEPTHPIGWGDKAVEVTGEGLHGFYGMKYSELKL